MDQSRYIFPFFSETQKPSGCIFAASEQEHIRQSLLLLLTVRQGERLLEPRFGNRLHEYAFLPNSESLRGQIQHHLESVIREQEPRIRDVTVKVEAIKGHPTGLGVTVHYQAVNETVPSSLQFHLDLQENSIGHR